MIWLEAEIRDRVARWKSGAFTEANRNELYAKMEELDRFINEVDRLRGALKESCRDKQDGRMRCVDYVRMRTKEGVEWTPAMLDDVLCPACKALEEKF